MLSAQQTILGSLTINRPGRLGQIGEVLDRVDPADLVEAAHREGLDCLLYANLRRAGLLETLPEDLVRALGERYRQTAALNMRRAGDLGELGQRLEASGARVVVLKGMALLDTLYEDPGLRPTGDIDLWVGTDELELLIATLREAGYEGEPFYPDTFRRGPTTIDIHTHLLGAERVRARELIFAAGQQPMFAGLLPTSYGAAVSRLGPAPEVFLLGLHLLKHNADRLLWLVEMNELVAAFGDDDGDQLLSLAHDMGQAASIRQVAFLADLLLVDATAPWYANLSRTDGLGRVHSAVLARRATRGSLPLWGPLVFFSAQSGVRGRVVSAFETLFPRPATLRQIFRDTRTSLWRLYVRRFGQLVGWVVR